VDDDEEVLTLASGVLRLQGYVVLEAATPDAALGAAKKNTRRRHAWLAFEDESSLSQQPVVRRTWAPRGETPILTHVGSHWKRLSIAGALAFRWDGRRSRFFFQTRPGTYKDVGLISFLRQLKRHFRGRRILLGLGFKP